MIKATFLRGRTLLLVALIAVLCSISTVHVSAQEGTATVKVEPDTLTIPEEDIGNSFTVNVTIAYQPVDPENLSQGIAGVEFKLGFNSAILNATSIDLPEGHFMTPEDPFNLYILALEVYSDRVEYGIALFGCAPPDWPEKPKNGTGVLATITFVSKAPGVTALDLYDVIVGSPPPNMEEIPSTDIDGTVTVIPEFPAFTVPLLFMVATVFAIILRRKSWLEKRRALSR